MMRSMFSGISGLRNHQTMMDVVGNNIANVNTSGYKSMRATFQESLTQVVRGATGGQPAQGGTNPMQLGLGTRMGSIDGVFGQGAPQTTGRATDLAIQGDGFFIVGAPGNERYTRSGAFGFDAIATNSGGVAGNFGRLVTPDGELVRAVGGGAVEVDFDAYSGITINQNGEVLGRDVATGNTTVLATLELASFANPNGLERVGGGMYAVTPASGPAQAGQAGDPAIGSIQAGSLEMSNVDLAQEFTSMILAQRGFQANSRTITSSDEMLQDLVNLKR
jgi:flagellar hook protein FlgE